MVVGFGFDGLMLFWVMVRCYWVVDHGFDLYFGSPTVMGRVPGSWT